MEPSSFGGCATALREAADLLRVAEDSEGTHLLRVTCRRTRVGLHLAGLRPLRADLDVIVRECGPLRDLDVVTTLSGLPSGLSHWVELQKEQVRPPVLALIASARFRGVVRALECLPPPPPGAFDAGLRAARERVRKAARRFERTPRWTVSHAGRDELARLPERPALREAHALRKALRSWRYGREWAGKDVRELIRLQDRFGALSDQTLLLRILSEWDRDGGDIPESVAQKVTSSVAEALSRLRPVAAKFRHLGRR